MVSEILGLGICPLGTASLGYGSPATSDQLPRQNSPFRYLDPATGDWQSTITPGILDNMNRNSQRVLLALMTEQGSSTAIPSFGNTANQLQKIDETFERELENRVRICLSSLTDVEKVVTITEIVTNEVNPGSVNYTVFFYDLEAERSDFLTLKQVNL